MPWLDSFTGNEVALIGTFLGSATGLLAILLGALFNAHLNRRRDDQLREKERGSVALALKAELRKFKSTLQNNIEILSDPKGDFLVPDLSNSIRVFPALIPKLGLLNEKAIESALLAYVLVEQYCESLILMGGQVEQNLPPPRRMIYMPMARSENVRTLNQNVAKKLDEAIAFLSD